MKKIEAIDIDLVNGAFSTGTAFYRITPEFRDFLNLCEERHGVIGFLWDGRDLNFGIILGDKQKAASDAN